MTESSPIVPSSPSTAPTPRRARSIGAILLGFVTVVALSICTDQLLHVLKVYPPWNEPMTDPKLNLLALAYRCVYGILGSYVAARFAPDRPMWHAMALGFIGLAISALGALATIPLHLGPAWYPIALVVTVLPCSWLGGKLAGSRK